MPDFMLRDVLSMAAAVLLFPLFLVILGEYIGRIYGEVNHEQMGFERAGKS